MISESLNVNTHPAGRGVVWVKNVISGNRIASLLFIHIATQAELLDNYNTGSMINTIGWLDNRQSVFDSNLPTRL